MKILIFFVCLIYLINGQTTTLDTRIYRTLQKSMDIVLTANSYHSAEISDRFRFSILGNFTQIDIKGNLANIDFGNGKLKRIEYKTLHAFVDLPVHIQAGFHFNYPSATINGLKTNYLGYSLKVQLNQWLWSDFVSLSAQVNTHKIEIDDQLISTTNSANLHISKNFWNFEPYLGISYNQNKTEIGSYSNLQTEVLYKAGLSYQLYFFYLYGETLFHIHDNFSVGLSFKF
ncbi:MAG: hypothetical protein KDD94_03570 [Calditrichaeota bacterium]|nr:hypothetical protein [Calditrichota bacterium]